MAAEKKIVGLVGDATQESSHRVLAGIAEYLQDRPEISLRDFRMPPRAPETADSPPLWTGRVDGVIVAITKVYGTNDRQTADWLLSGGAPVVNVARDWRDRRIPSVVTDQNALVRMAANHLLECHCESFLIVGFDRALTASNFRAAAFEKQLRRRGRKLARLNVKCLLRGIKDVELIRKEKKLSALLRKLKKPLGVWAINDNFARGVVALCEHLDLRVPDEVRVLGVDDLMASRLYAPTITTIRTPHQRNGYVAMQTLHHMLAGKPAPPSTFLPPAELLLRASTGGQIATNDDLRETLTYIAQHCGSELPVPHLAARVNMSRRSFELKFRALLGRSPREEIRRVRLERAKTLLFRTEVSVRSVCETVGFQDTTDFCKFFRQQVGMSPLEYRKVVR